MNDWPILPPNGSPKPTRFIKLISDIVKILHLVNKWDHNLLMESTGPTNSNNICLRLVKMVATLYADIVAKKIFLQFELSFR